MTTKELHINIGYTEGMKDANDIIQESANNMQKTPEVLSFMLKLSELMFKASVNQDKTCKRIAEKYKPSSEKISNH